MCLISATCAGRLRLRIYLKCLARNLIPRDVLPLRIEQDDVVDDMDFVVRCQPI